MKKIFITLTFILATFIAVTFAVSAHILNGDKVLSSFNIINVDNVSFTFDVNFEKVKAAKSYDIVIYDTNNREVFGQKVYNTKNILELSMLEYDSDYKMVVYAYDKIGESISVKNPYKFKYTEPTFSKENDLVLNDEKDHSLIIDGDLTKKDYKLLIYDNKVKIKEEILKDNIYKVDKKSYFGLEKKLDFVILDNNIKISEVSLYNKISPISELKITSPASGNILDYNDVTLTYEGGNNATKYMVQIYNGDHLVKETSVRKNRFVVSSEFFEKSEEYKIIIKALYKDYSDFSKETTVSFTMNEKDTLKPAYINKNWKHIITGTKVTLNNPNNDGVIYYTTNGDDPTISGTEYTKPITIKDNILLRSVIKEPKKNNSIISEFQMNIAPKTSYSVYLSPSNQDGNFGVASTGFTSEMHEMNDIANYIEKRLIENNVRVYRNSPHGNITLWTGDSRYYGVDLHLALHSNASINHNIFGIETWINEQSSKTYSLANLIQEDLLGIYYTSDEGSNRGVKYANGSLGEVNELAVPFGLLIEVAHHDHEKDAAWMMQNKQLIANTITDSVLKYFGLK